MALDFSALPPVLLEPGKPPSRMRWILVFFVLTFLGSFAVLMLWPVGEPTRTPWFWACMTMFPAGLSGFLVLRRYSVYEGRVLDANAASEARRHYIEQEYARERIPVLVLGSAIRMTEDDKLNSDQKISDGALTLGARSSNHEKNQSVAARWFAPVEARLAANDSERHGQVLEWLYECLLDDLLKPLTLLPPELALRVQLDLSGYTGEVDPIEMWQERWDNRGLRAASFALAPLNIDLMVLDTWLDEVGGPFERHAVLLISISLSAVVAADPPDSSAEAGVGLLMTSIIPVSKYGLQPVAAIHRPVRSLNDDLDHAMSHALRFAGTEQQSPKILWMTGFDGESVGPLHASITRVGVTAEPNETLVECDLDRTVGRAGSSAGWLALVCAASNAGRSGVPQFIAQRHADHTILAVVAPSTFESQGKPVLA